MLLPALVLPRLVSGEEGLPPLNEQGIAAVAELDHVIDAYRRARPEEGSEVEAELLVRLMRASIALAAAVGGVFFDMLRDRLEPMLRGLWQEELESADDEKKFALHQLGRALESFGVILEAAARQTDSVPAEIVARIALVNQELLARPDVPLDADTRQIVRWETDLAAALASLGGGAEELSFWAARASRGARVVQALLAMAVSNRDQGERLLDEARHSWDDWDEDEVREELRPWDGD